MSKRNKIIYWIVTIWLAFGMLSGEIFPSVLTLVLVVASWFLRPADRRLV